MNETYFGIDNGIHFYVNNNDLFILNEGENSTYKIIKKLNISDFLVKNYNTAQVILETFRERSDKNTSLDDYTSEYMDKHSYIDEDIKALIDCLTIRKIQLIFNILVDYSEDNPLLCHPAYVKKYDDKTFNMFKRFTPANYECTLVHINGKINTVITTYSYLNFIAYLCYTADETVKRFKICPGCYQGFIDGTIIKYFKSDVDKSRYARLAKEDVVLDEYKRNLNTLFIDFRYKYIILDFVKLMRPTIFKMVRWDSIEKNNKGIYHFSDSNIEDKVLLNNYKKIALSNWQEIIKKYNLNDDYATIFNK